ncbi:hypothetical protein BU24DRAFT_455958 [Aaosphaeria arxii CBS 175.79]|uniref:F-box domain-containing protein n=1 Tax=Aaosphaeria arxii CBS 175.79 TaxID=1450172 RepID=A0A6A5X826_9PLEO|nr:uncharacterized protein BU24DRAFT_455958 [Aaosphaeria arxii CBS 175.79]KAF2009049.1 hypothetical protein BU24DRAFT_455958 [Aaosphaeria arxii CBS 175.79]
MAPRRDDRGAPQALRRSARIAAKARSSVSGHVQEQSTEDEKQGPKSVGGDVTPTVEVSNDEVVIVDHQQTVSNATSSGEDVSMEDAGSDEDEGAVAADESFQDEDSIGAEEDEQSAEVEELSNQPHESKRCRFLELPRELRDEIYGYLVGKNRDRRGSYYERLYRHSVGMVPRPPPKCPLQPRRASLDGSTRFLRTNRQIFEEGKAILYSQHFFVIRMNIFCENLMPVLWVTEYSRKFRKMNRGFWELYSIKNLVIIINNTDDDVSGSGGSISDGKFYYCSQWDQLLSMKSLRTLRIAIEAHSYRWDDHGYAEDFPGRNPRKILWYRQIMRNLVAAIPKHVQSIKFGFDDFEEDDDDYYYNDVGMVPGSILRATYEEFKHLQGTDAAAICPDKD